MYTYFDYRGRYHNLSIPFYKTIHVNLLLKGFLAPVNHTYIKFRLREECLYFLISLHQVLKIELYRFFNKRINNIGLPALPDFALYKIHYLWTGIFHSVHGGYRFSPGWHFIHDTIIKISIGRQGKGTRN